MEDVPTVKPVEAGAKGESPTPVVEEKKDVPEAPKPTEGLKPEEPKPAPKHARAEDRIKHLWKQNKEKETVIIDKEKRIKELEGELEKQKLTEVPRPKREHFETDDAYAEALEGYLDKRFESKLSQRDAKRQEEFARVEYQKAWDGFNDLAAKLGDEEYPDVDKAMMGEGVIYSTLSREFVRTSPLGPQLAYHLYQHPDVAEHIAKMNINQASQALLDLQADIVKAKDTKLKSSAPAPITPVGESGGPLAKEITDPNLSQDEFNKMRREQIKKRREAGR